MILAITRMAPCPEPGTAIKPSQRLSASLYLAHSHPRALLFFPLPATMFLRLPVRRPCFLAEDVLPLGRGATLPRLPHWSLFRPRPCFLGPCFRSRPCLPVFPTGRRRICVSCHHCILAGGTSARSTEPDPPCTPADASGSSFHPFIFFIRFIFSAFY